MSGIALKFGRLQKQLPIKLFPKGKLGQNFDTFLVSGLMNKNILQELSKTIEEAIESEEFATQEDECKILTAMNEKIHTQINNFKKMYDPNNQAEDTGSSPMDDGMENDNGELTSTEQNLLIASIVVCRESEMDFQNPQPLDPNMNIQTLLDENSKKKIPLPLRIFFNFQLGFSKLEQIESSTPESRTPNVINSHKKKINESISIPKRFFCSIHNLPMEIVCLQCNKPVCLHCNNPFGSDQGTCSKMHQDQIVSIEEYEKLLIEEINSKKYDLEKISKEITNENRNFKEKLVNFDNQLKKNRQSKEKIENLFSKTNECANSSMNRSEELNYANIFEMEKAVVEIGQFFDTTRVEKDPYRLELMKYTTQLEKLVNKYDELKAQKDQFEMKNNEMSVQCLKLTQINRDLLSRNTELEEYCNSQDFTAENQALNEKIQELYAINEQFAQKNEEIISQNEQLHEEKKSLIQKTKELSKLNEDSSRAMTNFTSKQNQVLESKSEMEEKNKNLAQQIVDLNLKITSLNSRLEAMNEKYKKKKLKSQKIKEKIKALTSDKNSWNKEKFELSTKNVELNAKIGELSSKIEELKKSITDFESQKKEINENNTKLLMNCTEAQTKIKILTEELNQNALLLSNLSPTANKSPSNPQSPKTIENPSKSKIIETTETPNKSKIIESSSSNDTSRISPKSDSPRRGKIPNITIETEKILSDYDYDDEDGDEDDEDDEQDDEDEKGSEDDYDSEEEKKEEKKPAFEKIIQKGKASSSNLLSPQSNFPPPLSPSFARQGHHFGLEKTLSSTEISIKTPIRSLERTKSKPEIPEAFKLESLILTSNSFCKYVRGIVEDTIGMKKWKLVYRATRDGFSSIDFHSSCDDLNFPTLVIVKTANESIFGGFTTKNWRSGWGFITDNSAFIFSLSNTTKANPEPQKFLCTQAEKAIYGSDTSCAVFGKDLCISNKSNENRDSYCNLSNAYNAGVAAGSEKAKTLLCGTERFQTVEVELFAMM